MRDVWGYAHKHYYGKYGEKLGFDAEEDHFVSSRNKESNLVANYALCAEYIPFKDWHPMRRAYVTNCVSGKVLDAGCGVGTYSLMLKQRGLQVFPIDISPLIIEVAHLRGLTEAQTMDMHQLDFQDKLFDYVLCIGGAFGEASNSEDSAKNILVEFARVLKKNGVLSITSYFDPNSPLAQKHYDDHGALLHFRYEYLDLIGEWFPAVRFKRQHLQQILAVAGFEVKALADDPHSSLYAIVAERQ